MIDYDDGTHEDSPFPDSDVVVYPWRPLEQRASPRPLEQATRDERELKAANHLTNSTHSRGEKLLFKPDGLRQPSPRRKRQQGRERSREHAHARHAQADGVTSNGRGPVKAESPSSFDEDAEDSEEEEEEDDDEQWSEGGDDNREVARGGRRRDRWQRRAGKASRGRRSSLPAQVQQPRKRSQRARRACSAPKRLRARDGE